jgi:hypothetical protein
MNEVEISIKTNFKTTINLKKFFRNFALFIFAIFLSINNFEKFSEVFIAKIQAEIQPKNSARISGQNSNVNLRAKAN